MINFPRSYLDIYTISKVCGLMSNSDQSRLPSFNDISSSLTGFAALAANASNSSAPHNSKASSVQGASPTNSDDNSKRNTTFFVNQFSSSESNGQSASMMLMDEAASANSYGVHEYDQSAQTNSSTGKKRSRILSAPENKLEDILSQSKFLISRYGDLVLYLSLSRRLCSLP